MATNVILAILREATRKGASDVHLVAGTPVMIRVRGELVPIQGALVFDVETCASMIYEFMTAPQREVFERDGTVNATIALDTMRYRMNVALQRQGMEAVFRLIPDQIPTPDQLNLPPAIVGLSETKNGLILVTGPTGSGKSSTLACLLELINQNRAEKIITIEDPIEFIYTSKRSFVSQREVGQHTPNFNLGLRDVLRQDPDVVLIGELRDHESIEAAIRFADTGHLVLSTLHSMDAPQAVERIIDVFPGPQQSQIRAQLATLLRSIIAQVLLPRLDGHGRVGAFELMINTPAISTMIRQNRTHEISSAMEMGSATGMKTFSRAITELVKQGVVDPAFMPVASSLSSARSRLSVE